MAAGMMVARGGTSHGLRWRCMLIATVAWALCSPASSQPAPAEDATEEAAARAFWWGDFEALEASYLRARADTVRKADGELPLARFRGGIARVVRRGDEANGAYYAQLQAQTHRWTVDHPQSALAHLLYARALYARGWHIRGETYASRVLPQAWADFEKYLGMAADHLAAHSGIVMADSTANVYLLMIGRGLGWSGERLWAVAADGLQKAPDDDALYDELLTAALPKWGGSVQAIDAVVAEAVRRTQSQRGLEMYARLYGAVDGQIDGPLFTSTKADWPRMRQGFRDMLSRRTSMDWTNRFAYFACLAQDKASAVELLDKVGSTPVTRYWGGSNGRQTFEVCTRWARSP
jgi:hypothetical protein